ncbi:SIMPL domain-containing protein [Luteimonas abyssi]|uniref:SIMPL domain-containing protein n=1 Tax=Luteimonas abyssi TaxID=1247514 RepID=UPI000737CAA7|nr:SIMPL domain-containing protein [Luteimonas abyssi]
MILRPLAAALLAATLATAAMSSHAQTPNAAAFQTAPDSTLLSVSAQAEASRTPDVATMSAGVVTQAADANAALRANAEQMNRLMRAIREAGLQDRDIQTSGLNIYPQYRHSENESPTITGYQANNTVSVKLRDVARIGDVIDALVANGANQVNGPNFEIDQPEEAYDEARRKAIELARKRADMYAESLGLRVRRIVSVSEGGGFNPPVPMMRMAAMDAVQATGSPISPGENTVSISLDVVFELGR